MPLLNSAILHKFEWPLKLQDFVMKIFLCGNIPPHQTNYVPDMNITELLPADTMQKLRPTAATQSVPYIRERDLERVFIQFSMWTDGD